MQKRRGGGDGRQRRGFCLFVILSSKLFGGRSAFPSSWAGSILRGRGSKGSGKQDRGRVHKPVEEGQRLGY